MAEQTPRGLARTLNGPIPGAADGPMTVEDGAW
jgi:hypothetical protein